MPQSGGPNVYAEFQALSNRVFVTAYQRSLEGRVPDGLADKPLSALMFTASRHERSFLRRTDEYPLLSITPMHPAALEHGETDHNPILSERLERISTKIANVTLDSSLRIAEYVPSEGTLADFRDARLWKNHPTPTGPNPDYLRLTPPKELARSTKFAHTVMQYVMSDRFTNQPNDMYGDTRLQGNFRIRMDPDLPLTGYEPRSFLVDYHETMMSTAEETQQRLDRLLLKVSASFPLVDDIRTTLNQQLAAAGRARKALDNKR